MIQKIHGLVTLALLAASCGGQPPSSSSNSPVAEPTRSAEDLDRTSYAFFLMDREFGELDIQIDEQGRRVTTFGFQDRGRGPKLRTTITTDDSGTMTGLVIDGHDYWKSPVDERWSFENGRHQWKNKTENGTSTEKNAFYLPLNGTPGENELLAQALLDAPDHSLPLLPAGRARIETVDQLMVSVPGGQRQATLYAISGLSLTPTFLWLDENRRLLANAGDWAVLIRRGWERTREVLQERQKQASQRLLETIARTAPRRHESGIVFRDVAVFDPASATVKRGMSVVVVGERIVRVGKEGTVTIPANARSIDGRGHTLLPGLWDMHVHVSSEDGIMHLAAGVTSVRDLANDTDTVLETRRRFDAGELIGPRVILAGFMDGTSEYTGPTKVVVDTVDQARDAIANYKKLGYEQIKIYSSINPKLVPDIADLVHANGMRLSGHIPAFMTAEQAVEQGFDEIQHANMLILNFLFDKVQDTRTPARFTAVGEYGADLDLQSDEVKAFIRLLVDKKTVIDPTVTIFESMLVARPGTVSPAFAAIADRLPIQLQRGLRNDGLPVPDGMDEQYRASFATMLRLIGLLHEAGVPIVAGTDAMAGFTLHRELELYVRAGIPTAQVLRLATLGSAEITGRDTTLGTVEPGKLADLVLVQGDPVARISDIRNTVLTVKNGVLYDSATLYQALGVGPRQ